MGRFLLGFVIGVAIGVAAVIFSAPRSGAATRQRLSDLLNDTLEAGRRASAAREQELWTDFRSRIEKKHS
jgi:gas vesicle protein